MSGLQNSRIEQRTLMEMIYRTERRKQTADDNQRGHRSQQEEWSDQVANYYSLMTTYHFTNIKQIPRDFEYLIILVINKCIIFKILLDLDNCY